MELNNGGPAFPQTHVHPKQGDLELIPGWMGKEGMSLRDWFAGMALQGLLTSPRIVHYGMDWGSYSQYAYKLADAMLKQREVGHGA